MKNKAIIDKLAEEQGSTLVLVLIAALVLSLLGISALTQSTTEISMSRNFQADKTALYVADGGIAFGINELRDTIDPSAVTVDETMPQVQGSVTFRSGSMNDTAAVPVQAFRSFPPPPPRGMSVELSGEIGVTITAWQLQIASQVAGRWRGLTRKELETVVALMSPEY